MWPQSVGVRPLLLALMLVAVSQAAPPGPVLPPNDHPVVVAEGIPSHHQPVSIRNNSTSSISSSTPSIKSNHNSSSSSSSNSSTQSIRPAVVASAAVAPAAAAVAAAPSPPLALLPHSRPTTTADSPPLTDDFLLHEYRATLTSPKFMPLLQHCPISPDTRLWCSGYLQAVRLWHRRRQQLAAAAGLPAVGFVSAAVESQADVFLASVRGAERANRQQYDGLDEFCGAWSQHVVAAAAAAEAPAGGERHGDFDLVGADCRKLCGALNAELVLVVNPVCRRIWVLVGADEAALEAGATGVKSGQAAQHSPPGKVSAVPVVVAGDGAGAAAAESVSVKSAAAGGSSTVASIQQPAAIGALDKEQPDLGNQLPVADKPAAKTEAPPPAEAADADSASVGPFVVEQQGGGIGNRDQLEDDDIDAADDAELAADAADRKTAEGLRSEDFVEDPGFAAHGGAAAAAAAATGNGGAEPTMRRDPFHADEESSFFSYFMFGMVVSVALYVLYHNRRLLLALLLEGRRRKGSSGTGGRRKHTAAYSKLDSNLEEAISASSGGNGGGGSLSGGRQSQPINY